MAEATEIDNERLTMGRFLTEIADEFGESCAIRFNREDISYIELQSRSRALAKALVAAGVVKGARVAVQMANRPEWAVASFATGLIGAVLVPINTFATSEERDYILRHSDASLLIVQPQLLKHRYLESLLKDHPSICEAPAGQLYLNALPQLRRVVCLEAGQGTVADYDSFIEAGATVPDAIIDEMSSEMHPMDDCCIIYTSGTTSNPKGVLHAHRAPVLQGHRFAELVLFTTEDRLYTSYPFFWTAGMAMSLMAPLAKGTKLILQEVFNPEEALLAIEQEKVTCIHAWPHQHKALGEHPSCKERDLTSLVKLDAFSALKPYAGIKDDNYGVHGSAYGLTETFTIASMTKADADASIREKTTGLPLYGNIFRIVDPDSGERLPQGKEGEITLKGLSFMRGYYKRLPEDYLDDDGFFHTQDGGFIDDDGYLHWTGRISSMIKTGGANVSPLEIENAAGKMPELRVGLPVGISHPIMGQVIVLCALKTAGADTDEARVRAFLKQHLAAYKLPKCVLFFKEDELSFTGSAKIQVGPLREAAIARLKSENITIDDHNYGSA